MKIASLDAAWKYLHQQELDSFDRLNSASPPAIASTTGNCPVDDSSDETSGGSGDESDDTTFRDLCFAALTDNQMVNLESKIDALLQLYKQLKSQWELSFRSPH